MRWSALAGFSGRRTGKSLAGFPRHAKFPQVMRNVRVAQRFDPLAVPA
jgi:hypothetical protein